jgi:uncharacterized protein
MTRRIQIVIGLLIALGLPFCHLGDLGRKYTGLGDLFGGEVFWWGLFVAIIAYVLFVERQPLSSIGYRRPGVGDIGFGVLAGIVMFMGIGMIFVFVLPALHMSLQRQMAGLYSAPLWFRLLTVTRAAFVEETVFRGYGFERLTELTGSRALAAVATWALFTMAHLSHWGWAQVIIAAFGGLVLTVLYVWRRNLWANIIAHWITDGVGFIFAGHG